LHIEEVHVYLHNEADTRTTKTLRSIPCLRIGQFI